MRSYSLSLRDRKARPSSMCTETRGSAYGSLGLIWAPICWMRGSISTASTCLAPIFRASAMSEPVPAPTTSTLFRGLSTARS